MNTAPVDSRNLQGFNRRNGPALSAQKRNGAPIYGSRLGAAAPNYGPARNSMHLPPLGDTSFSEQYKTFKAMGGVKKPTTLEMSKELQMKIRPTVVNKPFYKRSFRGPMPGLHENFPLGG